MELRKKIYKILKSNNAIVDMGLCACLGKTNKECIECTRGCLCNCDHELHLLDDLENFISTHYVERDRVNQLEGVKLLESALLFLKPKNIRTMEYRDEASELRHLADIADQKQRLINKIEQYLKSNKLEVTNE